MKEVWIDTGNNKKRTSIVAISNTGLLRTKDGTIRESKYREQIWLNGKIYKVHQFIAQHFIPKTQEDIELGRNEIDHKTHEPDGMNINDVRNLRWCTHKENSNFEERRKNLSKALKGKEREVRPRSEFSIKFYEHYGITHKDNPHLYSVEQGYWRHHNKKCSWE